MFDQKTYMQEYYKKNKEKLDARVKKWKEDRPDKDKEYSKTFRAKNRVRLNENARANRVECGEEINAKSRAYRQSSIHTFLSKKFSQLKKKKHHGKINEKYTSEITLKHLTNLWEQQNGLCAITKKKLEHTFSSPFSASVDRIDSSIGYLEGNVQLVCQSVNFAKNGYSNERIKLFWALPCEGGEPEYYI